MTLDLTDRTALVTGSTAGIGKATAHELAAAGATVYVNGRTEQRVHDAIKDIHETLPHAQLHPAPGDITTEEGISAITQALPQTDILINNAGTAELGSITELDDAQWHHLWNLNVMSGVRLSRHYLPHMKTKKWGRVIFVNSASAQEIPPHMIHYGTTKTAQLALARGLAETYPNTGITINSVLPGPTHSELTTRYFSYLQEQQPDTPLHQIEQEFLNAHHPHSLLGRFAEAEEVAHLITYLASPLSTATNGAALRVDGGTLHNLT
ncbi:SDR family oxidoreductase [Streptomyces sp. NA04227]|nr:SDR family oxidoreductase [Streptomyces sp. NA04227]